MRNETLISYRKKAGLSQSQLAKMAQITTRGYQMYELEGTLPNVVIAMRIADALQTTVPQLWGGGLTAE